MWKATRSERAQRLRRVPAVLAGSAAAVLAFSAAASADYETHPELDPAVRCAGAPHPDTGEITPAIPPSYELGEGGNSYSLVAEHRETGENFAVNTVFGPWQGDDADDAPFINDAFTDEAGNEVFLDDGSGSLQPITEATIDDVNGGEPVFNQVDPGGEKSLHCQRLFWDLPAPLELGVEAIAAPFAEDRIPRFPNGLTDRIPPMWVIYDSTGTKVGGAETANGNECPPDGPKEGCRARLCPEGEVGWWAPVLPDEDGDGEPDSFEPVEVTYDQMNNPFQPGVDSDGGGLEAVSGGPQQGPLYRLSCRRGSRASFGPWQMGTDPDMFDSLPEGTVRFESTARMDQDIAEGLICQDPNDPTNSDWTCVCGDGPDENGDGQDDRAFCYEKDGTYKGNDTEIQAHGRREWNVASDFYNHFSSHHGTCWNPETDATAGAQGVTGGSFTCNDVDDPWTASDVRHYNPDGEHADQYGNRYDKGACYEYQHVADGPDDPDGEGECYAGDADPECQNPETEGQMFRNATQLPGRLYVEIPDGRGVVSLEDQLWDCEHHVVSQLPAGNYGMSRKANYRLQKGGIVNPWDQATCDEDPPVDDAGDLAEHLCEVGQERGFKYPVGGSVGEMVIQYYTEPFTDTEVKSINVAFPVIQDVATTYYEPFTYNVHQIEWHAPFDLALGLVTTHAHHHNVASFVDVLPANPQRPNSQDAFCGGSGGSEQPEHLYTNWDWEDARICEYWKEEDGPVILRKGQVVRTTCYVNNGVTPEAIKHGLVGGQVMEGLKAEGAPIPEQPSTVPAWSDDPSNPAWGNILADSPVGRELLYGTHPPINYRVTYKCADNPYSNHEVLPFVANKPVCDRPQDVDADGDYIDGPYRNDRQCGDHGGWCIPSPIIFANVGEDEMCIPVFMFWPLDTLVEDPTETGGIELNEEAMQNLQEGNLDGVGTPGKIQKNPGDIGDCRDCEPLGW